MGVTKAVMAVVPQWSIRWESCTAEESERGRRLESAEEKYLIFVDEVIELEVTLLEDHHVVIGGRLRANETAAMRTIHWVPCTLPASASGLASGPCYREGDRSPRGGRGRRYQNEEA